MLVESWRVEMSRGTNFADDILDGSVPNTAFNGMLKAWNLYDSKGEAIGYSIEYKDRVEFSYHTKKIHEENAAYGNSLRERAVDLLCNTELPKAVIARILGCAATSIDRFSKGVRR